MTPRKEIAAQIKADNPNFIVNSFALTLPDNIQAGKPVIYVQREGFTVNPSNSIITHNLKVQVLFGKTVNDASEDALDAVVDAVMLSLEKLPDVFWQSATRAAFESFDGYEITLEANRPQVYKSQLLTTEE